MNEPDTRWSGLLSALEELQPVDLSHPLREGMPSWPAHPRFTHRLIEDFPDTTARHYGMCLGEHTGTHLDAASHIIAGAPDISRHPAPGLLQEAVVIQLPADESTRVSARMLLDWEHRNGTLAPGSAVLAAFGWDAHWGDPGYIRRWPAFTADAGRLLASRSLALLAVDTISVDPPEAETLPVHRALLSASAVIGENFANLRDLPQSCLLAVHPLRIPDGTGSPVRPVAYHRGRAGGL